MRVRITVILVVCSALAGAAWAGAQAAAGKPSASAARVAKHFPGRFVKVGSGFAFPTYLTATPADPNAYYVVERAGEIVIVRNGHRLPKPFLDIRNLISIGPTSEQGLLGMAFDPNYAVNGTYYVYYTNHQGNIRVEQFHRSAKDASRTDMKSGRIILAITHSLSDKHYAGELQFGPRDGDLYISVGDGGPPAGSNDNAQHLNTLLGKILRIDVHHHSRHHLYRIPKGNPFVHRRGALPQIYAYGLRNPYRFSFDSKTGAVWIGDVGENTWEEIDYRKPRNFAGTNFGWPRFEGPVIFDASDSAPGAVFPVISKHHYGGTAGSHEHWCAVMGGYVEHDPAVPKLGGRYLFADHCSGEIDEARINKAGHAYGVVPTGISIGGLPNGWGVDAHRHLYLVTVSGDIYRVVAR